MKMWKWLLVGGAGLLVLVAGGGWWAAHTLIKNSLTKDVIVEYLEKQWDCRADIETIRSNISATEADICLNNVNLAPRDAEVAKPLSERAPLPSGAGLVHIDGLVLEINPAALLTRKVKVKQLVILNCYVRDDVDVKGNSGLAALFEKPAPSETKTVGQTSTADAPTAPNPPPTVVANPSTVAEKIPATTESNAAEDSGDHDELADLTLEIGEILFDNVSLHLRNRQAKTLTDVEGVQLRVTDVDVATSDLAKRNQCKVQLSGRVKSTSRVKIGDEIKEVEVANFGFLSTGVVHPFDLDSRSLNPSAALSTRVEKGSIFGGTTTLGQAAAKDKTFSTMKDKFGLDVSDIVLGGALQEDAVIEVNLKNQRVEFAKDTRFSFPDYVVTLRQGTWLDAGHDEHQSSLLLVPSDMVSKKLIEGVKAKVGDGMANTALSIFNDGQGRLAFDIISTERLSKPKFKLGGQAGAIQQLFEGLGGGLLKGLLGQ